MFKLSKVAQALDGGRVFSVSFCLSGQTIKLIHYEAQQMEIVLIFLALLKSRFHTQIRLFLNHRNVLAQFCSIALKWI